MNQMNQLQKLFNYNGLFVRTVIIDGEPWFVLSDVCKALDLSTPAKVRERLEDGVSSTHTITDSLGREQQATIINEDGLYDVILDSRKPDARQFRKWITSEVIPSIRKTGTYSLQAPKSQAELMLMYAEQFVEYEKRINRLEADTAAAHHRIDNFDKIDVMGDPQQRLNKMIRLYAANSGLTFQQAWRNFKQAFNTAYRTNITMLIENYKMKNNLKDLSTPAYLAKVNRLDDAIRVADKLINQAS